MPVFNTYSLINQYFGEKIRGPVRASSPGARAPLRARRLRLLPVAGLRDWLQGYATGADGRRFIASAEHDSVNTRDGWRIRYVSWQDEPASSGAAITRPKRIDLARSTAQAGEVSMRIVIDSW